jgi:hypothetical protein
MAACMPERTHDPYAVPASQKTDRPLLKTSVREKQYFNFSTDFLLGKLTWTQYIVSYDLRFFVNVIQERNYHVGVQQAYTQECQFRQKPVPQRAYENVELGEAR